MTMCLGVARAEPAAESKTAPAPLPLSVQPSAQESVPPHPVPSPVPAMTGTPPAAVAAPAPKKSREVPAPVYAKVSEDPTPTLTPATFLATMRMAEHYKALADAGGWSQVPAGLTLKPGDRNPAVAALRGHLVMTGDLAADATHSDIYDDTLVAAVKSFQQRHGLPESGLVQRLTVAALNVPASVRQRQLAATVERLIGSKFPFGERYVVVNIPSATVETVENGAVARRYVAVVGKPDKATPSVETRVTDVNLNPTWTLPVSVIKNEIIPTMRKNPGYLVKNHIRMLGPGGVEVDSTTFDWSGEKAVNYTLRQDSGFDNSLGQLRIDMPNKFAVYMHDTPSKSLFAGNVRFHSHGCVRVGQVKEFAAWLLQGTEGPNGPGSTWGPIEIESGIATGEKRDIKLVKSVPVTFVYLTGYATPDGRAHFRDDIYGLDTPGTPAPSAATDVVTTGSITPRAVIKPARAGQPAPAATDLVPAARPVTSTKPASAPAARPDTGHRTPAATPVEGAVERAFLPPGLVGRRG
ncbi:L,D-transpeptidase family protein [Methylobacterium gnaphalii]